MIHGRDSPPASAYKIKSTFEKDIGSGKSFGLPHSAYNKVHIPGHNCNIAELPGPGAYDQKTTLG